MTATLVAVTARSVASEVIVVNATISTPSYRAVLKVRSFRLLVIAGATSEIGDWLYNVALLVYVFDRTESAVWVGLATIGRMLPSVLLGPVGGVIADRYERFRVMMGSNLLRVVVFAAMTVAVALEAGASVVIVLAMAATVAGAPYRPASTALVPSLVGASLLAPAMALLSTVFSVALVAGPALGAVILAAGSPAVAFGINAATFAVSTVVLNLIKPDRAPVTEAAVDDHDQDAPSIEPSAWKLFVDGVVAIRRTPYVPVVAIQLLAGTVGYGAETVLLVVYAQERLGVGADGYGYLMAAAGIGGVLAGVVSGRLAGRSRVAGTMTGSAALACLGSVGYALTGSLVAALVVAGIAGASLVTADVVSDVAITRAASGDVLGRIYGGLDGLAMAGTVAGALLAPIVLAQLGLTSTLMIFGGVATALTLVTLPRLLQMDTALVGTAAVTRQRAYLLAAVGVLTGAPRSALEQLAAAAEEQVLPAGVAVVTQGASADAFYVVLDGRLSVHFTPAPGGEPRVVAELGPADWFGEIGLLEGVPRTATVRSETGCRLLRIDGRTFLDVLTAHPGGAGLLRAGLVTRLGRTHPGWPVPAPSAS